MDSLKHWIQTNWVVQSDTSRLAEDLYKEVHAAYQQGVERVIIPGGQSVHALYRQLEQSVHQIPNAKFILSDERMVKPDEADSNEGQIQRGYPTLYQQLLSHHAIDTNQAEQVLSSQYLAVIGAGNDGHFASLFPTDTSFTKNELLHGYQKPGDAFLRQSLGYPVFLKARSVLLWMPGSLKAINALAFLQSDSGIPLFRLWNDLSEQHKSLKVYTDTACYQAFLSIIEQHVTSNPV